MNLFHYQIKLAIIESKDKHNLKYFSEMIF